MDSSDVLIKSIEDAGIEYIFGLPGPVIMNTNDKIYDSDVEFISTRHEQVATTMADGYARVTKQPGISLAHVGPGSANQIVGVGAVYRDNAPVIAIAGNEDLPRLERDVWHEWRARMSSTRLPSGPRRIERGTDTPWLAREALVKSVSGRPGPVFLDLPKETSQEDADYPESDTKFFSDHDFRVPIERPKPDPDRIQETVDYIEAAARPLFLAGGDAYGARRDPSSKR